MKSKFSLRNSLVIIILFPTLCLANANPLKSSGSFSLKWPYDSVPTAFASESSPHVVFLGGDGTYWLFNVETGENQLIAKDDLTGPEGHARGVFWGGGEVLLLYSKEVFDKKEPPQFKRGPKILRYGIEGASLRVSKWIHNQDILISDTVPYVLKGRKFAQPEDHDYSYHTPTQSGLVVINDQRYITSGYEDQSLEVRSLPDGKLLNQWVLGKWYSSRRITHIAVVDNRLLVATDGGRIEERSLETGEVIWSIRPCRGGGAYFRYSSQYQHMGRASSPPLESINIDGHIYYTCGRTFGVIARDDDQWRHEILLTKKQLPDAVSTVETLPHTNLSVLVLLEGDVLVADRNKREIVQALPKTRKWHPNSVTYIAATHQLLTVGEDGKIHLFEVPYENKSDNVMDGLRIRSSLLL